MCTNNKRTLLKPLQLVVQVVAFKEAYYLLKVLLGISTFSIKQFAGNLIPVNYFVILYIALYFLSPFLNMMIERIDEKNCFGSFLAVLIILFSVWPTVVDILQEITGKEFRGLSTIGAYGSQWGYSIVNFSMMYMIGAWLKYRKDDEKMRVNHAPGIFIAVCVLTVWACINDIIGYNVERSAWEYCNPVMIFLAVKIFLLFRQIEIRGRRLSKVINRLAQSSFSVYLLHFYLLPYIGIEKFVSSNVWTMVLHIIVSTVVIYLICWCVGEIYGYVSRPIYSVLKRKFMILDKNIVDGI